MNAELLMDCWSDLNKNAASGVDGVTAQMYAENLHAVGVDGKDVTHSTSLDPDARKGDARRLTLVRADALRRSVPLKMTLGRTK